MRKYSIWLLIILGLYFTALLICSTAEFQNVPATILFAGCIFTAILAGEMCGGKNWALQKL